MLSAATFSPQGVTDRVGQISALTILSPIRPERLGALRRRLALVAWTPGVGRPLLELSTIHYARWAIVSALPDPDGKGRPWRLNWHYLLFEATYDGGFKDYLDTFADVLPLRVQKIFGTCVGFESRVEQGPGSERNVIPPWAFRRFVNENRLRVEAFAVAQPDTVDAIRQAIGIERTEGQSDRQRGAALSRTAGVVKAMALGPPAAAPSVREAVLTPYLRRTRPSRSTNPLTIAAPLKDGVRAGEPAGHLSELPHTHSARLVLIDKSMQERLGHRHPDRLERDYVLFSCDHDGTLDDYVDAIRSKPGLGNGLFGHCLGFPGAGDARDFRAWVDRHRLDTQYYVTGYAPRSVSELATMVDARNRIAGWSLDGIPRPEQKS